MATLRLFGAALLPEHVERITRLKADHAAAKGRDLLRRGDGKSVPARTGTWFVTTQGKDIGPRPEDHLNWVVQLLSRHLPQLKALMPDLQADLSLLVHDPVFDIASLPPELVRQALASGDLEVEVPDRGIDVVLTPRNVAEYVPD